VISIGTSDFTLFIRRIHFHQTEEKTMSDGYELFCEMTIAEARSRELYQWDADQIACACANWLKREATVAAPQTDGIVPTTSGGF
jgi:hypothetical protein